MDAFRNQQHYSFETIRCDNAGENKSFIEKGNGKDWKFAIDPEYTPRDTPQFNETVETKSRYAPTGQNQCRRRRIFHQD